MNQTSVQTQEEITHKALFFCSYLTECNEFRYEVDETQMQNVIEKDFIHLDDYIFGG